MTNFYFGYTSDIVQNNIGRNRNYKSATLKHVILLSAPANVFSVTDKRLLDAGF